MSNALKISKKVLTIGVTLATIAWSVVGSAFVALLPAGAAVCPDLKPGDLIKVTGKPAIYAVNKDKEPIAFVIIVNGQHGNIWRYREVEDKIVTALANFTRNAG